MKRLLLFVLILAVPLLSGCQAAILVLGAMMLAGDDDALTRDEIAALVEENRETLLADIAAGDYARTLALEGVQEVRDRLASEGYVEYDCGGWGMVAEGGYVGFYYSADGSHKDLSSAGISTMVEIPMDDARLWKQQDGDNAYCSTPLGEGFFYYEEHF